MNLDYRVLQMFHQEAQRKEIEKTLNLLTTYRAASSKKEDYMGVVNELKNKMNQVLVGMKETVKENWAELKKRG